MFKIDNIQDFYQGRTVLITGHTGFKGSWFAKLLSKLGADVVGFSRPPPSNPNLFALLDFGDSLQDNRGDIREINEIRDVLEVTQPTVVFHLAAQAIVREGYNQPRGTFETNIQGTVNVLDAISSVDSVNAAVMITSDKCYADLTNEYYHRESDPLGGNDPYSASKACAEHVTKAYQSSILTGTKIASARAGKVIPDCVESIAEKKSIKLRNPSAIRPWQFVLEPLMGYLRLAELLHRGKDVEGGWNFGPNTSKLVSVQDLVESIISKWGKGEYMISGEQGPPEKSFLQIESTKSRAELGWFPVYDIHKAIDETTKWYKKYYQSKIDMDEITNNQVEEYIDTMKINNGTLEKS
jgi:CDP-glucose 4,6-dehydratase